MNWFKFIYAQQAALTTNKYGKKFFSVYGNTFPIKDQLKALGFRYFNGTWGIGAEILLNNPEKRQQLESMGISTAILDSEDVSTVAPTPQPAQAEPAKPETPTQATLNDMKKGVEEAIKTAIENGQSVAASLLQHVDNMIEKLATQVDEAASQEFIKSFLKFSAKFHKYSFGNQILIWIQDPEATDVAGEKQWFQKFGRQLTDRSKPIEIIAPIISTSKDAKDIKAKMSKEEWNQVKNKYERVFFKTVKVYDIRFTEIVPGWVGKDGEKPFEGSAGWRQDNNESTEEIESMINVTIDWAKSLNIDIDSEEMRATTGGYSAGGKIRINNTFDGINKFSTLVHEIAHEVLHQTHEGRGNIKKYQWDRQALEIDAETTAYIVLQHFGFETTDTPNYLALWKAKGEDVKKRRETISKASGAIIAGITKQMSQTKVDVD